VLTGRARAASAVFSRADANARAVAAIRQRLDGLPLALELAAARVSVLSPAALLDRLQRYLPLLTGGDPELGVDPMNREPEIPAGADPLDRELCELQRRERLELLARPDLGGGPREAPLDVEQLEREIERLAAFESAVLRSRAWRLIQALRRPFGRAW
jgi:hypothetical protein